ncbi:pantetheine-phosphate adenylyltransferase [Prochlorococcus sp. MIT 1223]|uniref:pantetheine-phosphate adenylyltransferase n=1 Tax=Prochlorococcus sp. MIT 1223 TaxID=3096217 RepID=UPI002A74C5E8|nr:pantetheine-phosphate adenylyltransferase [Prochlorococcus sp. MIT 1223]
MKALYPGSFDPFTNGHLDLVKRSCDLFGNVLIAVLKNPSKLPTFNLERRIEHISEATKELKHVQIISFEGLTVDCAKDNSVDLIIRGLRAMSDFEYELQIAHTNRSLNSDYETVFLATETHYSFLSSSVVKEVARFGGDTTQMVPRIVSEDLKKTFER